MDYYIWNRWEQIAIYFLLPIYCFCEQMNFSKSIRILGLLFQFILFPLWFISIFIGLSILIIIMCIDTWGEL